MELIFEGRLLYLSDDVVALEDTDGFNMVLLEDIACDDRTITCKAVFSHPYGVNLRYDWVFERISVEITEDYAVIVKLTRTVNSKKWEVTIPSLES